ncbi:DUF393 domain-containing protein [Flaviflexus ciconiae]|uniref:DUF393 domain-containing protein n=2 Tax=Flaviflexus ciconiae TaxID=2496867 RepID=A0A3Q9G0Z5_9ACTO|nr:DUF393 domain-containing protein [Flaviflexus ciconiae]
MSARKRNGGDGMNHLGNTGPSVPICVYDRGCKMCARMAKFASKRTHVEFTGFADLTSRGVNPAEYSQHLVYAGETVERGHRAVAAVLATMGRPWSWVGRIINLRPVEPIARRAYAWVARNRSCSALGNGACSIKK